MSFWKKYFCSYRSEIKAVKMQQEIYYYKTTYTVNILS